MNKKPSKNKIKDEKHCFTCCFAITGEVKIRAITEAEARKNFWNWYDKHLPQISSIENELLKALQWKGDKNTILFEIFNESD